MKIRNAVRYWKIRRAIKRLEGNMKWFGYPMPKASVLSSYRRWRRGFRHLAPVVRAAGVTAEQAYAAFRSAPT